MRRLSFSILRRQRESSSRYHKPFQLRFALTFFCFVAMILAACGTGDAGGGTQKARADKQVFVSPLEGIPDIETFDPALAGDLASINAIDMVFTGLVDRKSVV
jgi:hypothetical protein